MTRSASIHLGTVALNDQSFTQELNASIHLALSYLLLIRCVLSDASCGSSTRGFLSERSRGMLMNIGIANYLGALECNGLLHARRRDSLRRSRRFWLLWAKARG
jgi:hypothetical protein